MKKFNRLESIKKIIIQKGFCSINDLFGEIGTSESTIRRDLSILEQQGFIERYHGGAVDYAMLSHIKRLNINIEDKEEIGKKAALLVSDGQIVILGAGSTVSILGNYLINKKRLTIITTSISIARQLSSNIGFKIILTGGEMDLENHSLTGHLAELTLQQVNADISFFSCDSISPSLEVMNVSFEIASLKKFILRASSQKVIIADSSKFGKVNLASIGSISQFNKLVVDSNLSHEYVKRIEDLGTEVII